jgi:hypothetical protein
LQNIAGEQALADEAPLPGETLLCHGQNVDQSALADFKPDEIGHQSRKTLEGNGVAGAQINRKGLEVRSERRAGLEPLRRLGLEALRTARTAPAIEQHPRHVRPDLRDLDAIIFMHGRLRDTRHVGRTMRTARRRHLALARRVRMQRPMRPRMRPAIGFLRSLSRRLAAKARRKAGVVRRLRRLAKLVAKRRILFFQSGDARLHFREPRQQGRDQPILLVTRQKLGRPRHPSIESDSRPQRHFQHAPESIRRTGVSN